MNKKIILLLSLISLANTLRENQPEKAKFQDNLQVNLDLGLAVKKGIFPFNGAQIANQPKHDLFGKPNVYKII